jgi:ketosteroid isomerase-like protein
MSRRILFGAGTSVLAAAAAIPQLAHAETPLGAENDALIRKHYKAWDDKDWHTEDMLLAPDFTFSSAAGDDHISKSAFKKQCWDTQARHIKGFKLLRLFGSGNEAFAMYDCLTDMGKTFRNVEYFQLRNAKVESIMCYFGAASNFPSAVNARRG